MGSPRREGRSASSWATRAIPWGKLSEHALALLHPHRGWRAGCPRSRGSMSPRSKASSATKNSPSRPSPSATTGLCSPPRPYMGPLTLLRTGVRPCRTSRGVTSGRAARRWGAPPLLLLLHSAALLLAVVLQLSPGPHPLFLHRTAQQRASQGSLQCTQQTGLGAGQDAAFALACTPCCLLIC
jgi:hypothetical protein